MSQEHFTAAEAACAAQLAVLTDLIAYIERGEGDVYALLDQAKALVEPAGPGQYVLARLAAAEAVIGAARALHRVALTDRIVLHQRLTALNAAVRLYDVAKARDG